MILESILAVAILVVFVIVARRIPDAMREHNGATAPVAPSPAEAAASPRRFPFMNWLKKTVPPTVPPIPATPETAARKNLEQREQVLSDESFLKEGDAYLESGKFKEAERAFLHGVAKNPKNPRLYNRLGAIYLKQRSYRDPLEAFEAARTFDPSRASRHFNVALAAWHLGNLSKAREAIGQAISLDPDSAKYQQLKSQIEEQ